MNFNYYYNNIPGQGLSRNNLIYTSLISDDRKVFVQWFHNDLKYHKGQNEILDPDLMELKWHREIKYLKVMYNNFKDAIPNILDIDEKNKKIYLEIDGIDFWNSAKCDVNNYNKVISNWEEQLLNITKIHKLLGLYKFSLHPSSYWPIRGQLKSINYFFTYHESEGPISIADHASHIYSSRQDTMKPIVESMGLNWDLPESLNKLQLLCFESFRANYTNVFINNSKEIYND